MKVVRTSDMPWGDALTRGAYRNRRKGLPGERLMAGVWELAPGAKSFPLHSHRVTEEAMFVLSGTARVRTTEGETPIGPGDYVSFPPGGPAHQLLNDGTEPLVYFAVSANQGFDAVDYPESGKFAVAVGRPPTGARMIFRADSQVDYFDGDPDAGNPEGER